MPKKLTTTDFIERAKIVHGDYYDYSNVVYVNKSTAVMIVCPVHGAWLQKPIAHLYEKKACRNCTMKKNHGDIHPGQRAEVKEKRRATNIERYGSACPMSGSNTNSDTARKKRQDTFDLLYGGHPMKNISIAAKASAAWAKKSAEEIDIIMRKKTITYLKKYGYGNPFKDEATKKKIYELRCDRGDWTRDHLLNDFALYKRKAWWRTELSWREYESDINPEGHQRGSFYHLDHMLSLADGFSLQIPPEIIGHVANLRIIDSHSNKSKGRCSLLTYNQLIIKILDTIPF